MLVKEQKGKIVLIIDPDEVEIDEKLQTKEFKDWKKASAKLDKRIEDLEKRSEELKKKSK